MIRARRIAPTLCGAVLALALAAPAVAQQRPPARPQAQAQQPPRPQHIGTHGDWEAATVNENGRKVCYMVSRPQSTRAAPQGRRPAFLLVTHRPNSPNEISFISGYSYPQRARVTATVDRTAINLYTDGGTAWVRAENVNAAIDNFRRGRDVVIAGSPPRGNAQVQDTVSLRGFTAAYRAISEACNVRIR
ncbi:MAG: hypothetical protein IT557_05975 [Alphaproteobacteria bacterium]|nr:hypothetical protein [Alphaproteobacteria bacterium]